MAVLAACFSEDFCKCSNALFASVKAGSEIVENGLSSGSEQRKRSMTALRWISLRSFCKLTMCHFYSSQRCNNSSEKHSVLLLTFLLSQVRKFGSARTSKPFSKLNTMVKIVVVVVVT